MYTLTRHFPFLPESGLRTSSVLILFMKDISSPILSYPILFFSDPVNTLHPFFSLSDFLPNFYFFDIYFLPNHSLTPFTPYRSHAIHGHSKVSLKNRFAIKMYSESNALKGTFSFHSLVVLSILLSN